MFISYLVALWQHEYKRVCKKPTSSMKVLETKEIDEIDSTNIISSLRIKATAAFLLGLTFHTRSTFESVIHLKGRHITLKKWSTSKCLHHFHQVHSRLKLELNSQEVEYFFRKKHACIRVAWTHGEEHKSVNSIIE